MHQAMTCGDVVSLQASKVGCSTQAELQVTPGARRADSHRASTLHSRASLSPPQTTRSSACHSSALPAREDLVSKRPKPTSLPRRQTALVLVLEYCTPRSSLIASTIAILPTRSPSPRDSPPRGATASRGTSQDGFDGCRNVHHPEAGKEAADAELWEERPPELVADADAP